VRTLGRVGRRGASYSWGLDVAVVTARWHGTAILCGCRSGLCIHWSGRDSSSCLHEITCGVVLRLDGRGRHSGLGSKSALCSHWCGWHVFLMFGGRGFTSRGQGTFKKLSKVSILFGRLLALGHDGGKGPANRGKGR